MARTARKTDKEKYEDWQKKIADFFITDLQRVKEETENGIENPRLSWKKGWVTFMQKSMASGKDYSGSNQMLLTLVNYIKGYTDSRWVTYNQIIQHNKECKENEKWNIPKDKISAQDGHMFSIRYVSTRYLYENDKKYYTKKQRDEMLRRSGGKINKDDFREFYKIGYNNVYNVSIVDGIAPETSIEVEFDNEVVNKLVSNFLDDTGIELQHAQQGSAFYEPARDRICLPMQSNFNDEQGYYSVLLHEVGHSIGHKDRLNRTGVSGVVDKREYAREELIAELTSVLLNTRFNIHIDEDFDNKYNNNLAYIESWIQILNDDPRILMESFDKALEGYGYFLDHSQFELYQEYFENNQEDELTKAKQVILEYLNEEFDQIHTNEVFSDMEHIGVAYTTTEESDQEIQVELDLKNFKLSRYLDSELIETVEFDDITEMTDKCLTNLDFSDLTFVDNLPTKSKDNIKISVGDSL